MVTNDPMPVWAQVLLAVLVALPPTLLALAALLASLHNGRNAAIAEAKAERKADTVIAKLDDNTVLTQKVEKQTNGLVVQLENEIAELKRKLNEALRQRK